jgi:hypothetical protein
MIKRNILSIFLVSVALLSVQDFVRAAKRVELKNEVRLGFGLQTYGRLLSVDNGYSIFVQEVSPALNAWVINIFDPTGKKVTSLDASRQIDGAKDLWVIDVSVGQSGLIAVSVVVENGQTSPVALLMVYNLSGDLLNAQRVDTELVKLRVDSDNSIWGVGRGVGDKNPEKAPMFYKYTDNARKFDGFFPRSGFPSNERLTKDAVGNGSVVGVVSFGLAERNVWCWFPTTQELVVFDKNGSNLRRFQTGVPVSSDDPALNRSRVVSTELTKSGTLVSVVGFFSTRQRAAKAYLYAWDSATPHWEKLSNHGVESFASRLIGVDGNDLIFAPFKGAMILTWQTLFSD